MENKAYISLVKALEYRNIENDIFKEVYKEEPKISNIIKQYENAKKNEKKHINDILIDIYENEKYSKGTFNGIMEDWTDLYLELSGINSIEELGNSVLERIDSYHRLMEKDGYMEDIKIVKKENKKDSKRSHIQIDLKCPYRRFCENYQKCVRSAVLKHVIKDGTYTPMLKKYWKEKDKKCTLKISGPEKAIDQYLKDLQDSEKGEDVLSFL